MERRHWTFSRDIYSSANLKDTYAKPLKINHGIEERKEGMSEEQETIEQRVRRLRTEYKAKEEQCEHSRFWSTEHRSSFIQSKATIELTRANLPGAIKPTDETDYVYTIMRLTITGCS